MTSDDNHDAATPVPSRRLGAALLALILLTAGPMAVTAAGATQSTPAVPAEPAFVIALEADGSARATLTVPFDLTTPAEHDAFDALRENASAREARIGVFASRMRAISARTEANTSRDMRISEPAIQFIERGDTGIVALSVTWEGLAARSGDTLVLSEPFSIGFTIDRQLVILAPAGFTVESITPEPATRTDAELTMAAGSDLDGFRVELVEEQTSDVTHTDGQSGFGLALAIVAILTAVGILNRRWRH